MNIFDKIFSKLYRYDENLKSYVPTRWSVVLVASLLVIFATFVAISIIRFQT